MVFAGRNFFWLCVGIVGFLIGAQCAASWGYTNEWMVLIMALVLGCLGALLAVFFEWLAVVFGVGFLGGGYVLMKLFPLTDGQGLNAWPIFVIGGILGMCLMVIIFDWTLIVISSLLGATLLVDAFHGTEKWHDILFISCVVTGILVQYLTLVDTAGNQGKSTGKT